MTTTTFKKYNFGENSPYWSMVEPLLFDIWGDGILKTKTRYLHATSMFGWIVLVPKFIGWLVLKSAILTLVIFILYSLFPKTLSVSFDLIFSGMQMRSDLWAYKLLAYALIIQSIIFVLGDNFKDFVTESILCLLLLLTNMLPLRYLAKGLKNENSFAQLIAQSMGKRFVQFTLAMPQDSLDQWDKVFSLYQNSNRSLARDELEKLADEHAQKSI